MTTLRACLVSTWCKIKYERNSVYDVKAPYNFRQNINADYDVVAEAEAILRSAALATV